MKCLFHGFSQNSLWEIDKFHYGVVARYFAKSIKVSSFLSRIGQGFHYFKMTLKIIMCVLLGYKYVNKTGEWMTLNGREKKWSWNSWNSIRHFHMTYFKSSLVKKVHILSPEKKKQKLKAKWTMQNSLVVKGAKERVYVNNRPIIFQVSS